MSGWTAKAWVTALALTIVLATAPAAHADAPTPGLAQLTWHECAYWPDKRSVVRCGRLLLDGPAPATLPVVVVQHDRAGPSRSAMLFLQGGPGGASWLGTEEFSWPSWARLVGLTQDLVVYDQRGTGLADPSLSCPEIDEVVRPALAAGWYSDQSFFLFEKATQRCHARLIAEGHDLNQFTTLRNAEDVVALMAALPYSDWTLFGTSYGSRIALEVMRLKPDGLRSVILDGVLPPGAAWWDEDPHLVETSIAEIGAACPTRLMNKRSCTGSTEDFMQSLQALLDGLSRQPRWIEVFDWTGGAPYKVRIDPPVLMSALQTATTYAAGANVAREAIVAAARSDRSDLDWLLESWAFEQIGYDLHDPVHLSVTCDMFRGLSARPLGDEASAPGQHATHVADEAFIDHCTYWSESRAPDIMRQAVVSDVPTLLFSGEYDSITPAAWGDRAAAGLRNSHHFVLPQGGHVALFDDRCAMKIMRDFLSDPTNAPRSYCLERGQSDAWAVR